MVKWTRCLFLKRSALRIPDPSVILVIDSNSLLSRSFAHLTKEDLVWFHVTPNSKVTVASSNRVVDPVGCEASCLFHCTHASSISQKCTARRSSRRCWEWIRQPSDSITTSLALDLVNSAFLISWLLSIAVAFSIPLHFPTYHCSQSFSRSVWVSGIYASDWIWHSGDGFARVQWCGWSRGYPSFLRFTHHGVLRGSVRSDSGRFVQYYLDD